jgi:hypothetical protein
MMNDLSALPQPVRDAMLVMDDWLPQTDEDGKPNVWRIVRAELLRLYGEKFSDRTYAALKSRMEHAEAELAKLRARIADAPVRVLPTAPDASGLVGRRFAMVKLGDGE